MDLSFVPASELKTDEAAALVAEAWLAERAAVPFLPPCDVPGDILASLNHLLRHGTGVGALENGRLVGFLAGFPAEQFFGTAAGVYCPLYGHGAASGNRLKLYRALYAEAAARWVSEGRTSHAVTVFAHDDIVVDSLFKLGFGMRCIDLIRESRRLPALSPLDGLEIRRTVPGDAENLAALRVLQPAFYLASPIFMPKPAHDPVKDHLKWLDDGERYEWAAWLNGKPVGIMRLSPTAETFVSDHPSVMNISDTYVAQDQRGAGIGARLLDTVQEWLLTHEIPLCGVDCESINPSGSDFWLKYFTPYTWSMTRRVDERAASVT